MAVILATANCAQPLGQALYGLLFGGLGSWGGLVMVGAACLAAVIALAARPTFQTLEAEMDRKPQGPTVP